MLKQTTSKSFVRKNISANVYQTLVLALGHLALVPIFVRTWGIGLYGEWLVLATIPTYLALSDFGIAQALGNRFVAECHNQNFRSAQEFLGACYRYQVLISCALVAILGFCVATLPVAEWLRLSHIAPPQATIVLMILAVSSAVAVQQGMLSGVFRVGNVYDRLLRLQGHHRALEVATTATLLLLEYGPIALAGALLALRLILYATVHVFASQTSTCLKIDLRLGRWRNVRALLPAGVAFLAIPISSAFVNQATLFVVNWKGGAEQVVTLNILRQLNRLLQQLSFILGNAIRPELTRLYLSDRSSTMQSLLRNSLRIFCAVSALFVATMLIFGGNLISIWTDGLRVDRVLAGIFALESVAAGALYIASSVAWSCNRIAAISFAQVLLNSLALLCSVMFYSRIGLVGVGVSFSIANVLCLIQVYCVNRTIHRKEHRI